MREVGSLLSTQDAASRVLVYRLEGLSFENYAEMKIFSHRRDFKKH